MKKPARSFSLDMAKVVAARRRHLEKFEQYFLEGIAKSLVKKSPEVTGQYKGSWRVAGSRARIGEAQPEKGMAAFARLKNSIANIAPGSRVHFTNIAPYAPLVEHGGPRNRPHKVIARTKAEANTIARNAMRRARR